LPWSLILLKHGSSILLWKAKLFFESLEKELEERDIDGDGVEYITDFGEN